MLQTPALLAAQRAAKLQQQQQQNGSLLALSKPEDKNKTSGSGSGSGSGSNLQSQSVRKLGGLLSPVAKEAVGVKIGSLEHPNEHYEEWLRKKEQKRLLEKQQEREKQQLLQQQKESCEQQLNDMRRQSFAKWLRAKDEERARERERLKELKEKERLMEQERKLKVEQEAERRLRQWEEKKLQEQKRQKAQRALEIARMEEERAIKQRLGEVAFQKWLDDTELRPKLHQNNQHLIANCGNNLYQHRADGCRCESVASAISVREIPSWREPPDRGAVQGSGDDKSGCKGTGKFGGGQFDQLQRREQKSIEGFAASQQQQQPASAAATIQQSS